MTVLVVGKGGTLGAFLTARLSAEGVELRADPGALRPGAEPLPEVVRASVVVNASGPRVRPGLSFADYFREHVEVSSRIVRSMQPGSHLVHLSSTAVFGARGERLAAGDPEAPTLFPSAAYACAKLGAEAMVRALARERRVRVTVLRPTMVYGPGVDSALESIRRLASRGVSLRLSPGRLRQHLVHIDLLADAVARAVVTTPRDGERVLLVADPFVLCNDDLVVRGGVPVPIPLGVAGAASRAIAVSRLGPQLTLEALAVLGIDNEFDWETGMSELGLDPARYARERTFDPYFRGAA